MSNQYPECCECCICLEEINKKHKDVVTCTTCNNLFHYNCIIKSEQTTCPLCRQSIINNSTNYKNYCFNNMDDHNRYLFKIDTYLKKWKRQNCLAENHHFTLETLGDWGLFRGELRFDYKYMYIKCTQCNKVDIVE